MPNSMSRQEIADIGALARDWISGEYPVTPDEGVARERSDVAWAEAAGLGWPGMLVEEDLGGTALGLQAYAALAEEVGRELETGPWLPTVLVAPTILPNSDLPNSADLLGGIARGGLRFALAHDEGPHHRQGAASLARAGAGGGWILEADKRFVIDGAKADWHLVTAVADGELSLFLVDARHASCVPLDTFDGRSMAHVRYEGAAELVGGKPVAELALDLARLGLATEMLGAARRSLEITADYLRTREQFGVPIGSFQALQHRAAQRLVANELAASCVEEAWANAAAGGAALGIEACVAKLVTGEALHAATREMIQMHGGIGMTAEHVAGRYLKWSEASERLFGDGNFLQARFATLSGF